MNFYVHNSGTKTDGTSPQPRDFLRYFESEPPWCSVWKFWYLTFRKKMWVQIGQSKFKSLGQSLTLVSHRTVFEHSLLFHMFESNHSSPTRVSSHRPSLLVWCRYLHTRRTYTTANANNCFIIHAEYQPRNMLTYIRKVQSFKTSAYSSTVSE